MTAVHQAPDLDVAVLDDHLLLHDPSRATLYVLDRSARMVWDACAEAASADEVVDAVALVSGAPKDAVDLDVQRTLAILRAGGLLRPRWGPVTKRRPVTRPAATTPDGRPRTDPRTSDRPASVGDAATTRRSPSGELAGGAVRASMLGRSVTIGSPDPEVVSRLGRVLRGVRDQEGFAPSLEPTAATYSVTAPSAGDTWVLRLDGSALCGPGPLDDVLCHLLWHLDHQAVTEASSWLALHASAVLGPTGVVAIAGQPGAGKSTLTAAATAAGLAYVSDEVTAVDLDTLEVVPYAQPIRLDERAVALLDHLGAAPAPAAWARGSIGTTERHVDPALVGAIATRPAPLAAIVLPDRHRQSPLRSPPRPPVDAALALAAISFNLDRTRDGGLRALAAIASRTPVIDLATADLASAVAEVARLSGITEP